MRRPPFLVLRPRCGSAVSRRRSTSSSGVSPRCLPIRPPPRGAGQLLALQLQAEVHVRPPRRPLPCRVTITPSRSSSRYARFTVITLTATDRQRPDRRELVPRLPVPDRERCRICSMICRYMGRRSACEIVSSLCMSLCTVYTAIHASARAERVEPRKPRPAAARRYGPPGPVYTVGRPVGIGARLRGGGSPGQQSGRAQRPRVLERASLGACLTGGATRTHGRRAKQKRQTRGTLMPSMLSPLISARARLTPSRRLARPQRAGRPASTHRADGEASPARPACNRACLTGSSTPTSRRWSRTTRHGAASAEREDHRERLRDEAGGAFWDSADGPSIAATSSTSSSATPHRSRRAERRRQQDDVHGAAEGAERRRSPRSRRSRPTRAKRIGSGTRTTSRRCRRRCSSRFARPSRIRTTA